MALGDVRLHLAKHGWVVIRSRVLDDLCLWVWDRNANPPQGLRRLPTYTRGEIALLIKRGKESLIGTHRAKRMFPGAKIEKPNTS